MEVTEKTYEAILYKLLVLESAQGTSPRQTISPEEIAEQIQEWIETNAPIGIGTLVERARFFDNFKE